MSQSAIECVAKRKRTTSVTIYPTGTGFYACGSPDGCLLRDGQELAVFLGGRWISGSIEHRSHAAPQFIAQKDRTICGLSSGMKVRLLQRKEV